MLMSVVQIHLSPPSFMHKLPTTLLLNIGHALDHMFLLIFATAVTSIAKDFGISRWEDMMPYGVAAFFFFGIGSLPAGRLGDLWGRRPMMIVFFIGIGLSAILVSITQSPLQLALALALLGCFASIYHPVGIPMLVQGETRPGRAIGINGLSGNLGLAAAALVTGLFVKYFGWRMAFVIPGIVTLLLGVLFAFIVKPSPAPATKKKSATGSHEGMSMRKLLLIMTIASTSGSMMFNFSTNSNFELLTDRFVQISQDPAQIGFYLAMVYAAASFTQLLVGTLIDKIALKPLYLGIVAIQLVALAAATTSGGWMFYASLILFMAAIFGAIPFTDAMIVRYVDDAMRSRVAGMRLAVALGASSLAVWLIGPIVKQAGFGRLLAVMAATSCITLCVVSLLPKQKAPVPMTT